jgi:hypothetical protein
MAMGRCRECKKPVSSEAVTCPSCGVSKPYVAKKIGVLGWVGVALVGALFFTTCSNLENATKPSTSASPSSPPRPTEAQLEAANRLAMQSLKPAEVRVMMKDKLLVLCERASPSLNYIKAEVRGSALYCVHSFYSQHSLSIGSLAPVMSAWVQEWQPELKQAGIKRVGVYGTGEFASGSWFEIK